MEAKEKARKLIEQFENILPSPSGGSYEEMRSEEANVEIMSKECAIILCDEILEIIGSLDKSEYVSFMLKNDLTMETEYDTHFHGYDLEAYFEKVKEEIEKR